jgi:metal-responsive CopG/Arc/MetJ family transcriptional regulator
MARVHIVMPDELIEELDKIVGKRQRSEFVTSAVEVALKRRRRAEAAERFAGSLRDSNTPGWESSEAIVEWVRALRHSPDDDALVERLRERE